MEALECQPTFDCTATVAADVLTAVSFVHRRENERRKKDERGEYMIEMEVEIAVKREEEEKTREESIG